jgi:tRNA-dihydrouridine synthase
MAGITTSAFRRLCADFGGYGGLYTEMLAAKALYSENIAASPFTRRRPQEGKVIYQLRLTGDEDIQRAVAALEPMQPDALDINCGCPAPEVARRGGGFGLFRDEPRLAAVIERTRKAWSGPLLIKCRIGEEAPGWEEILVKRLHLFEQLGVDAVTVHPRFSHEKLKRYARWQLFPWIASQTRLPLIANGDIFSAAMLQAKEPILASVQGLMIGRMAVVKPWFFAELSGHKPLIDYAEVWQRHYRYTLEDFIPPKAIGRIKEFSAYYARNFLFGHDLYKRVQGSSELSHLFDRAMEFFATNPAITAQPDVSGI